MQKLKKQTNSVPSVPGSYTGGRKIFRKTKKYSEEKQGVYFD